MTKSIELIASKKPRGRNGGRTALPDDEKREQANFYLPRWLLEAFKKLIPAAADRSNLILVWVRTYVINNGESDRLLAQSSLVTKILNYLEATDAPQELIDELESVIVARASDEVKIAEGVTRVGDSFVV
ncbi:hypothetical protein QUA70_12295 [Microcoleus sp. LAD1_D5]|uniref:hypothetical protein n=1 Tax=unclassified Microcoleus TaxID=2642155 RepID=UPI002FCF5FB9